MQNTPYRNYLEASPFSEPIFFEAPQIKHFYEQHLHKVEETPNKRAPPILTLITSPADPLSIARRKLLLSRNVDFFADHLDLLASDRKLRLEEPMTGIKSTKAPALSSKENEPEMMSATKHHEQEAYGQGYNSLDESKDDDDDRSEDSDKDSKSRGGKDEIRKRKRKSNHQLKILKWEFEKDGFWDKEKILNVAKTTGLSESQVYKWCWDQKKKLEAMGKDKNKFKINLDDKENIPPRESYGMSKNSKYISKIRVKPRGLNGMRSNQKLKLKNMSDNNIIVDDVNKRLTFL